MNRANSGRRPPPDANSIETKYLASTVGPALIRGLAEIVERRPNDPIEYLATFLYKQVDNTRAQQQKENDVKQLEVERQQAEEEKQHRAQLKNEIRALRQQEENERKQREAEEKRKHEAEELAKRHKEIAAAPPALPAVREEEDDVFVVEFGETELHRQAAVKDADLSKLLRDNFQSIASRNAEGKTPRDVAAEAGLQENVDQIDAYCVELLRNGNTKAINDLLLCGYTELVNQLKANDDNEDDTNNFINNDMPQLLEKIKELQQAIKNGNTETVETMISDRKNIALYRDSEGSSSLHDAIESRQYNIALNLVQKYPSLALVKDIRDRTSLDLLNSIDEDSVTDDQRDTYDQLKEALTSASTNQEAD